MYRTLLIGLLLISAFNCDRRESSPENTGSESDEAGESSCDDHSGCPPGAHCFCDERDNIVLATLDENGDNQPDRRTVMRYDSQNRRTSIEMDVGVDGTVDARAAYSYDERGVMTEQWDRNANGLFEALKVFDTDGNLLYSETFDEADESLERRCVYDPPCPSRHGGPDCSRVCTDDPVTELGPAEQCGQAIEHVYAFVDATAIGASEPEQMAMAAARDLALRSCVSEGVSESVLECVLSARTYSELWDLRECEAIRQEQPSWLLVGGAVQPSQSADWADMTPDELRETLR